MMDIDRKHIAAWKEQLAELESIDLGAPGLDRMATLVRMKRIFNESKSVEKAAIRDLSDYLYKQRPQGATSAELQAYFDRTDCHIMCLRGPLLGFRTKTHRLFLLESSSLSETDLMKAKEFLQRLINLYLSPSADHPLIAKMQNIINAAHLKRSQIAQMQVLIKDINARLESTRSIQADLEKMINTVNAEEALLVVGVNNKQKQLNELLAVELPR